MNLANAGREGVTFFFVLSGFILVYVYGQPSSQSGMTVAPKAFWRARFARIMPAYWLGLLMGTPLLLYSTFVSHITPYGKFAAGVLLIPFLLQAWVPSVVETWNPPSWSLSVEAVFYASFPLLLRYTRDLRWDHILYISMALLLVMELFLHTIAPHVSNEFCWFFPIFHLPKFMLGAALGRVFLFGPQLSSKRHVTIFLVGAVATVLVVGLRHVLPWWAWSNGVLAPLFGMVIFGAVRASYALRMLAIKPLVLLGEASYALYIVHMPFLFWWGWTISRFVRAKAEDPVMFPLFFLSVVALSLLVFVFIERPMRRLLLGHREHRMG